MSIHLKKLCAETKDIYQLTLLTAKKTLEKEIIWVQYTEDIATSDFLRGNELIITTGLCYKEKDWLKNFIEELISRKAGGLIVNTGKYIQPDDIDEEIITLCNEHKLPLIIMPWRIHLADIMQDYLNRLFLATQKENDITEHIKAVLFEPKLVKNYAEYFRRHDLDKKSFYMVVTAIKNETITDKLQEIFILRLKNIMNIIGERYLIFWQKDKLVILLFSNNIETIEKLLADIRQSFTFKQPDKKIIYGISSRHDEFTEMVSAFKEAAAAQIVAEAQQKNELFFDKIGIYRLLFTTNNKILLQKMHDSLLHPLVEFDNKHNSQLYNTLQTYLFNNNSLKLTAQIEFTHRNTINYRIIKIRNILDCDFDDAAMRFELMLAFYIAEYLKITEAIND